VDLCLQCTVVVVGKASLTLSSPCKSHLMSPRGTSHEPSTSIFHHTRFRSHEHVTRIAYKACSNLHKNAFSSFTASVSTLTAVRNAAMVQKARKQPGIKSCDALRHVFLPCAFALEQWPNAPQTVEWTCLQQAKLCGRLSLCLLIMRALNLL
jgi:hypothetical protein